MFKLLRDFAVEIFFPTSHLTQERKKNWVPTSYLREKDKICRWVFLSYESLNSGKWRIFLPTSYIQGQVRESQGSRWVRQGWSIATRRGCEKGKKKKRKEKRPRKARRSLQRRQGSMCPTPRILFFGSRVFGFGSSPSRLKYRLLRDLVYKEAMCKRSSGNGLLYAAKAEP